MNRRKRYLFAILGLLALITLLALAMNASGSGMATYENNENRASAIELDLPASLNGVWIWKSRNGTTNQDFWKFFAQAGQHIQINFRKYTNYNNPSPPFEGGTYYVKYEVWDLADRPIHEYHLTYRQQNLTDAYRRDSWGFIVPDYLAGRFTIKVWVDPPSQDPYREYAYYFLNVTVEDILSLDSQPDYNGVMGMRSGYDVDFNFEDYFDITLSAGESSSDEVTAVLGRGAADAGIYMEAWEFIPFGGTAQRDHMVNRTRVGSATSVTVKFIATYSGTYRFRVFRYFYDPGSTTYSLSVSIRSHAHDGNELAEQGVEVITSSKLRRVPIEMGYDTHDWYKVRLLAGDKLFKATVDIDDAAIGEGHAYELVVYNETGFVMWSDSTRDPGPSFRTTVELPPSGTVTIFDRNITYYVRFSVNAVDCQWGFSGFRSTYDITFALSNRPPILVEPFEDAYEWDEDESISIELDSHFMDHDGDKMEYIIYNKTSGFSYDVPGLSYFGYLNVTSPPNWNGEVWWRLRAVDEGQTESHHFIYVDLRFVVHGVPDRPLSNGTVRVTCDEEGSATYDLTKTFYDLDTGPGGVLTFGYNDTGQTDIGIILDDATGELTLLPGPDVTGTFQFEFYCYDDVLVYVPEVITLVVDPVNDIPRITGPIPTVRMLEGDDPVEVDLSAYFYDVDGDALTYHFSVPSEHSADMNVFHKNNLATESRIIIELTDPYFYAHVVINVTCKDPAGTTVQQDLVISISNVPNPATISYTPAGNPPDIEETESVTFRVTDVVDPDIPEFGLHTFTWTLDGVELADFNESTYTYTSDYDSSGPHTLKVVVTDPAGVTAATEPTWTFIVLNKNRAPTVSITTQPESLKEDEKTTLEVTVEDLDGDQLTINWWLIKSQQDKPLGTGMTVSVKLPAGMQTVEVEVDDGNGGKSTDSFTIEVEAVEEGGSLGLILGIVAVIVVVIVVALALMMKGRRKVVPERMDLEGLEKEYDPSPGAQGGGVPEYDPTPKDWEEYQRLE